MSDLKYSKASRYTALRSTDLEDTWFLIGFQNTWDTRFLTKSLEDARFFRDTRFLTKSLEDAWFLVLIYVLDNKHTASTWHLTCQVGGGAKSIQKCIPWLEMSICVKTAAYPVWASGLIPMRCLNFHLYVQPANAFENRFG